MSEFASSAFKNAVLKGIPPEEKGHLTVGENGHACLTAAGLGDSMLALFDRLYQGIDEVSLRVASEQSSWKLDAMRAPSWWWIRLCWHLVLVGVEGARVLSCLSTNV